MFCKYVEQSLAKTELNFDSIVQTFEAPLALIERISSLSIVIDRAEFSTDSNSVNDGSELRHLTTTDGEEFQLLAVDDRCGILTTLHRWQYRISTPRHY
jgi:hypothetical protein